MHSRRPHSLSRSLRPATWRAWNDRKELLVFSQNAKARDVAELLFPILYIDVDGLQEDSPDEVKAAIAQAQYEPFTELRLLEEDSSEYRTAVNRMARRLVDIANTVAGRGR